jgi:hypothetical protein
LVFLEETEISDCQVADDEVQVLDLLAGEPFDLLCA